ncbi:MAG TPA: OsmC family protein [Kiritimatiellia bacterium]|nr:OsmC family protein [Kiritimatiellia bacterium]
MTGEYIGGLRCELKHNPSGTVIETDAPADNHGKAERFSPTDLMGAALISCMITTLAIKTREKGWSFEGAKMRVEKHMSTDAPRRIVRLPVEVWIPIDLGPADRTEIETILANCPAYKSLHPDIETPLKIYWPEE